ncbi:GNAT family N-acetyltransferase [Paraglaciecola hydrolytica]|uniref:Acetyltransferase n=1 Tax=Paraglaciecola hydrolytica TaxID=1799789 RepID=A0A148KLD9_9ALTE|nr:GNAT family N-acetyltransferase [Paraglaciecola hydrolytica]KXI27133.1 acetyltransferase [Paraglaciecola hydrolytica]
MDIKIATTSAQIESCFAVLKELRPHLVATEFVSTITRLHQSHGFCLVYLCAPDVKAVAGIRMAEWLYRGKYLEIEDLVTATNARSKGYGSTLFDWLCHYAKQHDCKQVRLVSGVQREDAHRFYLGKGMKYEAKYFSLNI